MPMSSRGIVWSGCVLAMLAVAAIAGAYFVYPDFFQSPTVTTAVAIRAPVSEAIYGTGTVEPERWAKVVPLQRRRLVELCRCEGQAVKVGQILGRQDDAEEVSALHELEINNDQLARDLDRAKRGLFRAGSTGHGFANHPKGRSNAKDLSCLSAAATRHAIADRNDGRGQHHTSGKGGGGCGAHGSRCRQCGSGRQ